MKKITLLAIACIAISAASCKKEYVCQCTTTGTSSSGSNTVVAPGVTITKRDIPKTSKKNAEAICGNYQQTTSTSYINQGVTYSFSEVQTSTCSLK